MVDGASAHCDLLIIGTGSLARHLLDVVSACAIGPALRVCVAGRDANRAAWIASAGNARARSLGGSACFRPGVLGYDASWTPGDLIAETQPRVTVQLASLQSPWDLARDSAWSRLVSEGGYGLTVSLQATLALRTARALAEVPGAGLLVNGCYPDLVNPILAANGCAPVAGLGNVAIAAALLATRLESGANEPVRVVAHHQHIAELQLPPSARRHAPRVWVGEREENGIATSLEDCMLPRDESLNALTAATPWMLLCCLLGRTAPARTHAPAPNGLTGGYPVRASEGSVELDLPASVTVQAAQSWNQEAAKRDGAWIEDGRIVYAPIATKELRRYSPELALGFAASDVEDAAAGFVELRSRLSPT